MNRLVPVATYVLALVLLVPWGPDFRFSDGGDAALWYAYHDQFWRRPVWGRDLADTYGPWAFVLHHFYHPDTYRLLLAIWCGLALLIGRAIDLGLGASALPWPAKLLASLGLVGALLVSIDGRFLFLAGVGILTLGRSHRAWSVAIAIVLTLAGLAKTSLMIAASVYLVAATVEDVTARRAPLALIAGALAFVALMLAAGQSPGDWPEYARLASAFARDHGRFAMFGPSVELLGFLVPAAIAVVMVLLVERRQGALGMARWFAFGCVVFLMWKAGFYRHDGGHVLIGLAPLYACAAWLVARHYARLETIALKAAGPNAYRASATILAGLAVLTGLWWLQSRPGYVMHKTARLEAQAMGLARALVGDLKHEAAYRATAAAEAARHPMPAVAGSIGFYGERSPLAAAILAGADYRVVPPLHHYLFPDAIDRVTADFVRSGKAPDWLVVTNFEGAMRELAIFERYAPAGLSSALGRHAMDWALLGRRPTPAPFDCSKAAPALVAFDQWIDIPGELGTISTLRVDIPVSLVGRVASFLFKLPLIDVTFMDSAGLISTGSPVPGGSTEFIVSPHLLSENPARLGENGSRVEFDPALFRPAKIRLGRSGKGWDWLAFLGYPSPPEVAFGRCRRD